jgi:hypothetical protein
MKPVLRLISLVVGSALTLVPLLGLLSFSYLVGEPPSSDPKGFGYFGLALLDGVALGGGLLFGVALGGGLLLAGLPSLVVGSIRPVFRSVAGVLLVVSVVAVFFIGFDGSVTVIVCPLVLLLNAMAFFYFVYPAKPFSDTCSRSAEHQ